MNHDSIEFHPSFSYERPLFQRNSPIKISRIPWTFPCFVKAAAIFQESSEERWLEERQAREAQLQGLEDGSFGLVRRYGGFSGQPYFREGSHGERYFLHLYIYIYIYIYICRYNRCIENYIDTLVSDSNTRNYIYIHTYIYIYRFTCDNMIFGFNDNAYIYIYICPWINQFVRVINIHLAIIQML